MLELDDDYLLIGKKTWTGGLAKLATSLRNSKKPYIIFHDESVVNKAVIQTIAIPWSELKTLDKTHKPIWWYDIQGLKKTSVKLEGLKNIGALFGMGFMDEENYKHIVEEHGLVEGDFRETIYPSGYMEIRKKF